MKIVFLHTDFLVYWPKRLYYLNTFLNNKGHTLTILEFAREGTNYYFYQDRNYLDILDWHTLFLGQSMKTLNRNDMKQVLFQKLDSLMPDIIFAGAIAFPSGALATQYGIKRKVPVVIFDNARLEDVPRPFYKNILKRLIYKNVSAVFCPAPSLIPTFSFFGFDKKSLFYGLNVIDNHFFATRTAGIRQRKERIEGLPENYFLGVGRQVARKNWDTLIRAFSMHLDRNPSSPYHLVLVGDGPENEHLRSIANDKVHFYPFHDRDELCGFYAHASAFILPSLYGETWGLVVNEAMSSSLPVLVSNQCGCASTLVKENLNGWVFDPRETESLAKLITDLSGLPQDVLLEMGQQSFRIISDWGLERFSDGVWHAIVHTMMGSPERGGPLSRLASRFWYGRYNVA